MTIAINVYAKKIQVQPDASDGIAVTLAGIDPSQVAQEFKMSELLDIYDTADIQTYLDKRNEDDRDE